MEVIGATDKIDFPEFGLSDVPAKTDTGANRSSIHCSKIKLETIDGEKVLTFHIPLDSSSGQNIFSTHDFFKKKIRSSSGHVEERYVVRTPIVLFGKKIKTSFSLTDRTEMKYPVLLGRKLLRKRFTVDVSKKDLSYSRKMSSTV